MNLLITGAWDGAVEYQSELEAMGHSVVFMPYESGMLPCPASWPEAVVCCRLFSYHNIKAFDHLKFIQLTSAGYDQLPMDDICRFGIRVQNAKAVYSIPMAEFAVCGVLQLYKQSRFFTENQHAHRWEKNRCLSELAGKTVCIIGCGDVGIECARRFSAFDCRIVGVNRTAREMELFSKVYPLDSLCAAAAECDILVCCIALTAETHGMIGKEVFDCLRPDAVFVNIARGALVKEPDMLAWLRSGGRAVLDVFEEEPLPETSPLWDMENVLLTPHNSFVGEGNGERLSTLIRNSLSRLD